MFSCCKPLKVIIAQSATVSILPFLGTALLCIDKYFWNVTQPSTFPWFLLALGISDQRNVLCLLLPFLSHGGYLVLSAFVHPWSADSARYLIIFRLSMASKSGKKLLLTCPSVFAGLPLNSSDAAPECSKEQFLISRSFLLVDRQMVKHLNLWMCAQKPTESSFYMLQK